MKFIQNAPKIVTLSYIIKELWPKLGLDKDNSLKAEFMLNELVFKNSESISLDELDLGKMKEVFRGGDYNLP